MNLDSQEAAFRDARSCAASGRRSALPFLDAMRPALAFAAAKAPSRMAFVYFPNGVQLDSWYPADRKRHRAAAGTAAARAGAARSRTATTLLVLGGLTNDGGRAKGDGPGDHGRAGASYLTGVHPKKTFGKDIQAGVSIDQYRGAEAIGSATRFASLELGCEEGIQGGNCDNGYSCAYSNSISWRTPSTPNPPEIRPRAVFERLFGSRRARARPGAPRPHAALQPQRARLRAGGRTPPAGHARRHRPPQARRVPLRHSRDRSPHPERPSRRTRRA